MVMAGYIIYNYLINSKLLIIVAIMYTLSVTVFTFCNSAYFI
jgi:hypothetical protein